MSVFKEIDWYLYFFAWLFELFFVSILFNHMVIILFHLSQKKLRLNLTVLKRAVFEKKSFAFWRWKNYLWIQTKLYYFFCAWILVLDLFVKKTMWTQHKIVPDTLVIKYAGSLIMISSWMKSQKRRLMFQVNKLNKTSNSPESWYSFKVTCAFTFILFLQILTKKTAKDLKLLNRKIIWDKCLPSTQKLWQSEISSIRDKDTTGRANTSISAANQIQYDKARKESSESFHGYLSLQ